MRKALAQTKTLGTGEIAFSGREHLVAIGAPLDPKQMGMMLYMLRYEDELRDPKFALSGVKETQVNAQELSLAKQLIEGSSSKFVLSAYKNDYQAAVKRLVDAKRKGKSLSEPDPKPVINKVVDIMESLQGSLAKGIKAKASSAKKSGRRKKAA